VAARFGVWRLVGQSVGTADGAEAAQNPRKRAVPPRDYPQGRQKKEAGMAGKQSGAALPAGLPSAGQTPGTARPAGI
jgi:hypothetical protein